MCWCNDLFQIQSVHLPRITGPDGHWMNNATPAEGQSAISFSQKGYKTEKKKTTDLSQCWCGAVFVNLFRELESLRERVFFEGWNPHRVYHLRKRQGEPARERCNPDWHFFLPVSCHTTLEIWQDWPQQGEDEKLTLRNEIQAAEFLPQIAEGLLLPHVCFQHPLTHKNTAVAAQCPNLPFSVWVLQGDVCCLHTVGMRVRGEGTGRQKKKENYKRRIYFQSDVPSWPSTLISTVALKTQFPASNKRLKITRVTATLAQVRAASQVWLTIDVYLIRWKICSGACGCPFRADAHVTFFWGRPTPGSVGSGESALGIGE